MLVDKEHIGDRDLHNNLADRTPESGDQIAANEPADGSYFGLPNTRRKLKGAAEDVQGSSPILVSQGNEEEASDSKAAIVDCRSRVQNIESEAQLVLQRTPRSKANIELDKSPQHKEADEGEVERFARGGPVQGIIGVGRGRGEQTKLVAGPMNWKSVSGFVVHSSVYSLTVLQRDRPWSPEAVVAFVLLHPWRRGECRIICDVAQ